MPAHSFDGPRSTALTAGMLVTAIGVSVLVAWSVRFVPLVQIRPDLVPMHRMTALAAAMSGTCLILIAHRHPRPARGLAVLLLVMELVVCAEYSLDRDFGFDLLLGADYIKAGTFNPGRMSPSTAL